jgi:hypothetical protein
MSDRFLAMIGAVPVARRPRRGGNTFWPRFQRAIGARPVSEPSPEQRAAQRRAFLKAIGAEPVVRRADSPTSPLPAEREIARDKTTV